MGVFCLRLVDDLCTETRGQSLAGFHTCAWFGINLNLAIATLGFNKISPKLFAFKTYIYEYEFS